MSNSQISIPIPSPRNSSLTRKHKFLFLLVSAVIILTLIAFISVSNSSIDHQLHDTNTLPITRQRSRLSIDTNDSNESNILNTLFHNTLTSQQTALAITFSKQLDPICKQNNTYPSDCIQLLQSMINISITLNLDTSEINILSQRISYLNSLKHNNMKEPILYIHIPKTGGTGFGKWLTKISGKKTVHIWIPDGMQENMFDSKHYPNVNRNRRLNLRRRRRRLQKRIGTHRASINRNQINRNQINRNRMRRSKPKPFPSILYGHAAYGFDLLFLTKEEINKLELNGTDMIWEPRINFTYITILRHPLTRVPSHYFYHRNGLKDENHKWSMQKDLFDWIGWFEESKECLVQFISGCHQRSWYSKKYKNILEKDLNAWPRREQNESPDVFKNMSVTFEQYKIARKNLLLMGFVALTEYLSEGVEQLKVFWNIKRKQGSTHDNVNRKKPKKVIENDIKNKIMEYNKYDVKLWDLGYVLYLQQKVVIKYEYDIDINQRKKMSVHVNNNNVINNKNRYKNYPRQSNIGSNQDRLNYLKRVKYSQNNRNRNDK